MTLRDPASRPSCARLVLLVECDYVVRGRGGNGRGLSLSILLEQLKPTERRGSKPRCHRLTHGSKDAVAVKLADLVAPFASVAPSDCWMPEGFDRPGEANLLTAERLLPKEVQFDLRQWWLAVSSSITRPPMWDIASTCQVEGQRGLLLVEAKAHAHELDRAGKKPGNTQNDEHIRAAIAEANEGLGGQVQGWHLTADNHYQLCNRFAWAWKVASLGVPVVLVYLGFLTANEMCDRGRPFADALDWENVVKRHSQALVPSEIWGKRWTCSRQPLIPLIRSRDVPLNG